MYTFEKITEPFVGDHGECSFIKQYAILDPNNDVLAHVATEAEAEILLSHLNR